MSRRQLRSDDIDGFMRACHDEVIDLERVYGVRVLLSISQRVIRGQFTFRGEALIASGERLGDTVGSVELVWPTHSATSLHGLLFALTMRLGYAVGEAFQETQWETGNPYSGLATKGKEQ